MKTRTEYIINEWKNNGNWGGHHSYDFGPFDSLDAAKKWLPHIMRKRLKNWHHWSDEDIERALALELNEKNCIELGYGSKLGITNDDFSYEIRKKVVGVLTKSDKIKEDFNETTLIIR